MLLHLVLDGAWADTEAFWWPVLGVEWSTAELPELGRGAFNVVLELIGAATCWWLYRRFRLDEPERRADFLRTGRVGRDIVPGMRPSGRADRRAPRPHRGERLRAPARSPPRSRRSTSSAAARRRRSPRVLPAARVVSSPLRRTRETAEAFGRPVEIDERWIELDYGELDGTPLRDVPARRVGRLAGRPVVGARRAASRSSTSASGCGRPARRSRRRPPSATSSSSPTCRR